MPKRKKKFAVKLLIAGSVDYVVEATHEKEAIVIAKARAASQIIDDPCQWDYTGSAVAEEVKE